MLLVLLLDKCWGSQQNYSFKYFKTKRIHIIPGKLEITDHVMWLFPTLKTLIENQIKCRQTETNAVNQHMVIIYVS